MTCKHKNITQYIYPNKHLFKKGSLKNNKNNNVEDLFVVTPLDVYMIIVFQLNQYVC